MKEAKAAFNSVAKTTSRISIGLTLVSFGVTYADGNVFESRYYVQQTINTIGPFGPWGQVLQLDLEPLTRYGETKLRVGFENND